MRGFDYNTGTYSAYPSSTKTIGELEAELEAAIEEEHAKAKAAQIDIFVSKPISVREAILQKYLNSEIGKAIDEMSEVSIDTYRIKRLEEQVHTRRMNPFYPSMHDHHTFTVDSGTSHFSIKTESTAQFDYVTYEELLKAHIDKLAEEHFTSST
jgi:hypothetical protein